MKLQRIIPTLLLLFYVSLTAQTEEKEQTSIDSGTIENQFDYLIKNSNRYQEYKVVKRVWLDKLKKSVADSLGAVKTDLNNTQKELAAKEAEIKNLSSSLENSKSNVTQLNKEKDSIIFFGALISKPLYNSILWTIIGILLAGLIIFIFRFNRSNAVTKETKDKFFELENEYENHRQRSLEREQQIRRKLQDEINKHKKD